MIETQCQKKRVYNANAITSLSAPFWSLIKAKSKTVFYQPAVIVQQVAEMDGRGHTNSSKIPFSAFLP